MNKLVALFVLLFISTLAHAQEQTCSAFGSTDAFTWSSNPTTTFACTPSSLTPGGTGTRPKVRMNSKGAVVWWHCNDNFSYRLQMAAATTEKMTSGDMVKDVVAAYAGGSASTLNASIATYQDMGLNEPGLAEVWCPYWDEIKASQPAAIPYVVAKNGTSLTRPTYPFVAGVRNATSNGTVAVGATCSCVEGRIVEGSTAYCLVKPETVAVCVVKK